MLFVLYSEYGSRNSNVKARIQSFVRKMNYPVNNGLRLTTIAPKIQRQVPRMCSTAKTQVQRAKSKQKLSSAEEKNATIM